LRCDLARISYCTHPRLTVRLIFSGTQQQLLLYPHPLQVNLFVLEMLSNLHLRQSLRSASRYHHQRNCQPTSPQHPSSPSDLHASGSGSKRQVATPPTLEQRRVKKNTKTKGHVEPPVYPAREMSDMPELDQIGTTTSATSDWCQPPIPSSSDRSHRAKVGPCLTVIRRVINAKQEESEEEESKEEAGDDEVITTSKQSRSLRRRNCVVEDEECESQEQETGEARQLGERRNAIDYHEGRTNSR